MVASGLRVSLSRRRLLAGAAACALPAVLRAEPIYTPWDIARRFEQEVTRKLRVSELDTNLFMGITELQLAFEHQTLLAPQYMLVVDRNANVQTALLVWRLLPGSWQVLGASPVSTGGPVRADCFETPQGTFELVGTRGRGSARVCDFGWQRARNASGGPLSPMHLLARAANEESQRRLGNAHSDGAVLLSPCLMSFLDRYGLLDGDTGPGHRPVVPGRGRAMVVVDSEREDRPAWALAQA